MQGMPQVRAGPWTDTAACERDAPSAVAPMPNGPDSIAFSLWHNARRIDTLWPLRQRGLSARAGWRTAA